MAKAEARRWCAFARLSFEDGEVVVTPKDRSIFLISADKAVEACRDAVKREEGIERFELELLIPLHAWCVDHTDVVQTCYLPLPRGQVQVFIVTRIATFDFDLGCEIAELELKLAKNGWRISITQLPATPNESQAAFFDKKGALEFMPTADQHRRKAENNRKFLASISIDDYPDWVVVAVFYYAVHLIEGLRASSGHGDSTGHQDRLSYIQFNHPKIHSAYHVLQNASMLARYQSNSDFYAQFEKEGIEDRLIGVFLLQVEQYVQRNQSKSSGPKK